MKVPILFALVMLTPFARSPGQTADCSKHTIEVSAVDRNGDAVRNLPPSAFRGTLRSKPVQIDSVNRVVGAGRVVLLLDVSGSMMQPAWKLEGGLTFAGDVINALPTPPDSFGLMTFNEKITGEVRLGGSRQDAVNFLAMIAKGDRQLEVGRGRTAWLDAIVQARRQFVPGQFSDAICVITDGHDNSSKIDADVVRKELQAQNVRLFGFVIEAVSARTVEDEGPSPSTFRHLALATGGNVISLAYPEYGSATVMAPGAREPRRTPNACFHTRAHLHRKLASVTSLP